MNKEIINNIKEIYRNAPPDKIHQLIAKHFIPSIEEKKQNAEIPTPIQLCNDMLSQMPLNYWKYKNKTFEPCCGKGNFVIRIFEYYYNGLEELYPDIIERCKIIINECLYYADLTLLNVFITTEILKCEIQHRTNLDDLSDFKFNSYVGDTLKIDIKEIFNVDKFDAVIGNPPYNSSGNTATGNTIWQDFTKKALNE
jgi:type I restriction-modification system DNA methylase subunit